MNKLTFKEKLGYGSGSIGDAISYSFIGTFLMFFLTTVAELPPAHAGTITALGAVWNALFNPMIGYFSDKFQSRHGKRRPLILFFSIPLALTIMLLFTNVGLPAGAKTLYYAVMVMLFWTSYTGFFVPYLALGVEYTSDYDDRTVLRLFASIFNMIGSIICMVCPTLLVEVFTAHGLTLSLAWTVTAAIMGIIAAASIIVTVLVSGHKDERSPADAPRVRIHFSLVDIFREYISVARLKPVKYLIIASIASLVTFEMVISDMVYFLTYNMGYSPAKISMVLLMRSLFGMVLIPIVGKTALAIDKRGTLILFFSIGTIGMIILRILGVHSVATVLLYMILVSVCTCVYWSLMPSIYYDICEYDQLVSGVNRQGTIVSFQGLVEAVALGLGTLFLGLILQLAGFDGSAATQTKTALEWIFSSTTVIPVIFLVVASFAIYKYPITKEIHADIQRQLKDRNNL